MEKEAKRHPATYPELATVRWDGSIRMETFGFSAEEISYLSREEGSSTIFGSISLVKTRIRSKKWPATRLAICGPSSGDTREVVDAIRRRIRFRRVLTCAATLALWVIGSVTESQVDIQHQEHDEQE